MVGGGRSGPENVGQSTSLFFQIVGYGAGGGRPEKNPLRSVDDQGGQGVAEGFFM